MLPRHFHIIPQSPCVCADLLAKVLGEVRRPRKTFPIAMMAGAGILAVLYMVVNICYVSRLPFSLIPILPGL